MTEQFKERIKDLRLKNRMTGEELGKLVNVSKVSVWQWENGLNYPNNDILLKLADYFNVTTDYLLGRTDNPYPDINPDEFQIALYEGSEGLTPQGKQDLLRYMKYLKDTHEQEQKNKK